MNNNENNSNLSDQAIKIEESLSKIKHKIVVFSGKGGVGKTTVSVNLAYSLQSEGFLTGILDADITGPNVPKMLGINDDLIVLDTQIIPFEKYGTKIISMASMIKNGQALIWRGPMRSKVINQFLSDAIWGELDYLIADLPPGTGDEILTIAQQMKPDYAVVVTTPQEVSVMDAERAVNMAKKLEIKHIGIVENMAGFICPHCKNAIDIFGTGGGKQLAEKYNLPFLGSIPIDIDARKLGDNGKPILLKKPDSDVSKAMKNIACNIEYNFTNNIK